MKNALQILCSIILLMMIFSSCKRNSDEQLAINYYAYPVQEMVMIDSVDLDILTKNPQSHLFGKKVLGFQGNFEWTGVVAEKMVYDSVFLPTYLSPENFNNEISRLVKEKSMKWKKK